MSSESRQNIPKEKIISILLFFILCIIFFTILVSQSYFDLSKYGLSYSKATAANRVTPSKKVYISRTIPSGYILFGKTFTFDNQSLYEKINGKAPLYLKAGYRKLITQRFINRYNKKLWFEIYLYDMGSLKNAFSVYSRQKRYDSKNRRNVLYCYYTNNAEIFIRDNYYIEIIGSKQQANLMAAIAQCGRKIRIQLGNIKPIYELALFKNKYLKKGSEKYYLQNAFGFKGLSNVFSAQYKYNGSSTTVFIAGPFSIKKRNNLIKNYKNFLIKEGAKQESNHTSIPDLTILNYDRSIETIFSIKQFAVGVHEADDKKLGIKLSNILNKTIKRNLTVK